MKRVVPMILLALLAGCAVERQTPISVPPSVPTPTVVTSTTLQSAEGTTTTVPPEACPEGDVMLADGRLLEFDRPDSDSTRITGITWRTSGDCLLVTVTFATEDGAPATTPPSLDVRLMRGAGILRVGSETSASVVVDQIVETGMVQQLFVPVAEDGSRFIDFVLSGPLVGRARVLTSPARLEIELQPGGPQIGRPLITPEVILVEPDADAAADPVLDVAGYTSGDIEGLGVAALQGDSEVTSTTLELEPDATQWTAFDLALQVDAPYDTLRITTEDGSVVAAIPLTP